MPNTTDTSSDDTAEARVTVEWSCGHARSRVTQHHARCAAAAAAAAAIAPTIKKQSARSLGLSANMVMLQNDMNICVRDKRGTWPSFQNRPGDREVWYTHNNDDARAMHACKNTNTKGNRPRVTLAKGAAR